MNIASAKEQIKNAVRICLQKDELGRYRMPPVHQRPIFLQGAPGLGKTAIMQQISQELGIGFVSYSMTHHTRQSAVGLPMIVQKKFGDTTYSVSEYTMSEIIASVYECIEKTGNKEGLLFLDEINCISETLAPAMLLFLQYKKFGGHMLPEGWVIVTAGNQARYNKSVRDFDAATRDRLKYIIVEPDYDAWKTYAISQGISRTVVSFLDIRPNEFYVVETTVEGFCVVTPRSWEDLSKSILMYEELGLTVNQDLIGQYLQSDSVARDFALYYELYQKYRLAYDIEAILSHTYKEETLEEARKAESDERLTLTGLLLEALLGEMRECSIKRGAMKMIRDGLTANREKMENMADAAGVLAELCEELKQGAESEDERIREMYLQGYHILEKMEREIIGWRGDVFESCRICYDQFLAELEQQVRETQNRCGNLLHFLKEAFGEENELGLAVSDLTISPDAAAFIGQFLCLDFFKASTAMQLHKREDQLLQKVKVALDS